MDENLDKNVIATGVVNPITSHCGYNFITVTETRKVTMSNNIFSRLNPETQEEVDRINSLTGIEYTEAVADFITSIEPEELALLSIIKPSKISQIRGMTINSNQVLRLIAQIGANGLQEAIVTEKCEADADIIIEGVHRYTATDILFHGDEKGLYSHPNFDPAQGAKIMVKRLPEGFFPTVGRRQLIQAYLNRPSNKLACVKAEAEKALNRAFQDEVFGVVDTNNSKSIEQIKKGMNKWLRKYYAFSDGVVRGMTTRIVDEVVAEQAQVKGYRGSQASIFVQKPTNSHLTVGDEDCVWNAYSADGANWERRIGNIIASIASDPAEYDGKVFRHFVHFTNCSSGEKAVDKAFKKFFKEKWLKMKDMKVVNPVTGKLMVINMEGYLCPQKLDQDAQAIANEKVIPFDIIDPTSGESQYNMDVVDPSWLPADIITFDDD